MTIYTLLTVLSIFVYFLIYYFRNKLSKYLGVIDLPDEKRKIHNVPTPKTGSYSISLILFTCLILNYFFNFYSKDINLILIGTLLVFIIGFIDDRFKLSALTKIISISVITLIICILSDNLIIKEFYFYSLDFYFNLHIFSIFFTILCVLCLVNSLNLADGINGLAVGIIFFWLFYINQIYYHNNLNFLINIIFINLILIFIHNYMGRHFLGDSGSLMLSSFIAFLIIYLHNKNIDMPNSENSSETILIILIVPVLDMIRLLFERLSKKKNPGIGDNNHLHHYLIKKHSMLKALFAYFLLINIPILISFYSPINKLIIIIFIILIYFFLIFYYKTILKVK